MTRSHFVQGEQDGKIDLRSENAEGNQDSATSVFTIDNAQVDRPHRVAGIQVFRPFEKHVGPALLHESPVARRRRSRARQDLTVPVYNLLELTPAGRGDWYARLDYGVDVPWGAYPPTA